MTAPVVIDVADVSLAYKLYRKPADAVLESLLGGVRHDTFWALRNATFQVREGERLGIIGPNGAGKSTLLQVIAGNLAPTSGKASVHGKISSLLSLTPVWNGEDTGIENTRFNLLVQGVPESRVQELTEEIADFTELGAAMYRPVKTFSSGMSARLAFAIATAIDPEILIIDEVLGAGDGYFAARAARRMKTMCERGKALLFVSHATAAIRQLCTSCAWMENGAIRKIGPTETVLREYEEDMLRQDEETTRAGNIERMKALKEHAAPEDFERADMLRLRVRSEREPGVHDTHYIRRIALDVGGRTTEIPVAAAAADDAELEIFSCQWGRVFDRGEDVCRTLQPRSGARKGGHIVVRPPLGAAETPVRLIIESSSEGAGEALAVDGLDVVAGGWTDFSLRRTRLPGGWSRLEAEGRLTRAVSAEEVAEARAVAEERFSPPVELLDIAVCRNGEPVLSIMEFEPFSIRVTSRHHRATPQTSVNLNIVRADGVYVFFQPSGLTSNIADYVGESVTEFHFDPNPLGAGDYELNVFAVNGFDWDNIPPTDIYDKSIGAVHLKINPTRPISFGLINTAARVVQHLERPVATDALPEPTPFPPPYKRMLAFNSDVEFTTWESQLELIRIFGSRSLETAFSYWFFCDPTHTWRLFDEEDRWTREAPCALALARAGLLDTIHSFGGASHVNGVRIDRARIGAAFDRLEDAGVRTRVYSNHGGLTDAQNVGGPWTQPHADPLTASNYQAGDLVGHPAYHLDRTLRHGVRFFWLDVDRVGTQGWLRPTTAGTEDSLFASQVSRDGSPIIRFRRSDFDETPWPTRLDRQLEKALAGEAPGYSVIYNHFGYRRDESDRHAPNKTPFFSPQAYERLDALAALHRNGEVLVTTTERLLTFALLQSTRPWTIERRGDGICVTFEPSRPAGDARVTFSWDDLRGFALPVPDNLPVELRLGGETRAAERWVAGGVSYAGLQWAPLKTMDILDDALRRL